MKKIRFVLIAVIVMSAAAILLINPAKAISQKQNAGVAAMPDNVREILKNSCAACHNAGGKEFAIAHWSLSEWETYKARKQAKKANAICKAITKGSMPPSSVRTATPEKIPTSAQVVIICTWAKSLQNK